MRFGLAPTNQPTMLVRHPSVTAVVWYQAGRDGGYIFPGRRLLSSVIIAVFAFVLKPRSCHSAGCSGNRAGYQPTGLIYIFHLRHHGWLLVLNLGPPNWLPSATQSALIFYGLCILLWLLHIIANYFLGCRIPRVGIPTTWTLWEKKKKDPKPTRWMMEFGTGCCISSRML